MLKKIPFFIIIVYISLSCVFIHRISASVVDLDLWHEMALIRESLNLGYIPLEDVYAYTPTIYPVVHHEWGAGLIAYVLAVNFGASAIIYAKYILAFSIAILCLIIAKNRHLSIGGLVFLFPFSILLIDSGFSPIRAQMYSFLFTAILLLCLDLDRRGSRWWLIIWFPIYIIWLNIHGGFLVGLGLIGVHWAEQTLRRQPSKHLLATLIVMTAVIIINPYGGLYYTYILKAVIMPRPMISEWNPVWNSDIVYHLPIYGLSILILVYAILKTGVKNAHGVSVLLATAIAAASSDRLLPFYAIAWISYVPSYLQITTLGDAMNRTVLNWKKFLVLLFCFMGVLSLYKFFDNGKWKLRVPGEPSEESYFFYPVGPVRYLRDNNFTGNLMVPFDWGAYVSWKLYPNVLVSIDSRYEIAYPSWRIKENHGFYMADNNWKEVLEAYHTDLVLILRNMPILKLMAEYKVWNRVYEDRYWVLFSRPNLKLPMVNSSTRDFEGVFP